MRKEEKIATLDEDGTKFCEFWYFSKFKYYKSDELFFRLRITYDIRIGYVFKKVHLLKSSFTFCDKWVQTDLHVEVEYNSEPPSYEHRLKEVKEHGATSFTPREQKIHSPSMRAPFASPQPSYQQFLMKPQKARKNCASRPFIRFQTSVLIPFIFAFDKQKRIVYSLF